MITAALFDSEGNCVRLLTGTAKQLNANTKGGKTWRPIDPTIKRTQDVPNIGFLDPHPDLEERDF